MNLPLWAKILIVAASGAAVWALSFLSGQYPNAAMVFASINTAIVAVCSFLTGYPKSSEA